MGTRRDSIWKSLDWVTICVYLILIAFGWFSVCGASYDYGDRDFWDFSTRAGKQLVWIICSFGLGFVLLMLEDSVYDMFAYLIYIALAILLVVTIFIAPDTKGSRSWLVMGPVSLQPAEFAKFACQVYEFLFVHHEELEEYLDDGFPYFVPDDTYYLAAGDWLSVGIYCFLFGSVSGGDAGCGTVFRSVRGSLLCGRYSF